MTSYYYAEYLNREAYAKLEEQAIAEYFEEVAMAEYLEEKAMTEKEKGEAE